MVTLMGFKWEQESRKGIIMNVHERADVVAYRERFLLQVQKAERDGKVLIFGDGASVYIKEGERFCWHLVGEKLYSQTESEGE